MKGIIKTIQEDPQNAEQRIRESFIYNLSQGEIFWKKVSKYHNEKLGMEAGSDQKNRSNKSYWVIQLDGIKFKRSHLIYFFRYGVFPKLIDHINGNSLDDRIYNLRDTTTLINNRNHKGRNIRKIKSTGRFQVRLGKLNLGNVSTEEAAIKLYDKERKRLWRT